MPNLFHAPAIDAEIAAAGAGGGAEMNRLGLVVEKKFHVIDKAKEPASELDVQIVLGLHRNASARSRGQNSLQACQRLLGAAYVGQRLDAMRFVRVLSANANGAVGARGEPSAVDAEVGGPLGRETEQRQYQRTAGEDASGNESEGQRFQKTLLSGKR